jgi:hypothetical protein
MAKKRKKYLVTTDNSEAFACSLVTSPAVEETFVAFNEEKPMVEKFADEKKHMVTGVVAIPNKPIYRRNADGEEYDIVFSAEAIEKMSRDFLKNYKQHEVTLQHQENADGVYLVEQWIKTDMVYDKSLSVGLSRELPIGSWIQTYYVDSNDVWKRIENGELLGFSLECMLGLEEFETEFNKQNDNNMEVDNETFWSKLKSVLFEALGKEVEKKEEVVEEEVKLEEEKPTEAPVEEPKVDETPKEEPTPVKEEVKEEPKEAENKPTEVKEDVNTEEPKQDNHLEELISSLKAEIEALKEMNGGLQEKIKTLGKQPSTKPVSTNSKPNPADSYSQWRQQMAEYMR